MPLTLHFHPLASFCHKVLIALYENDTAFEPVIVDLGDPAQAEAFKKLSPMGKMPALHDSDRAETIWESTIVIEYLEQHYRGDRPLIPQATDAARRARFWDRFFDNYLQVPMQTIVLDNLRAQDRRDAFGVEQAHAQLASAYSFLEEAIGQRQWLLEDFSLAECAAAPALFYAHTVSPIPANQGNCRAYLARLMRRPSFARVLAEAEPYFPLFPLKERISRTPPDT